jgi:nitrogen regulatory protein PII
MKCLIFILNDVRKLSKLLHEWQHNGITGATILNSTGMAKALFANNDEAIIGSIRHLLDNDREENRTLFVLLHEDKVETAINVIESVVGDLHKPNTGLVFTIDVGSFKGSAFIEEK